jgi:hypothetical protein
MLALAIISGLIGGVIALRCRVFALFPVIFVMLAVIATGCVLRSAGVASILQSMAVAWLSVQFGYLAGAILRSASRELLGGRLDSNESLKMEQRKLIVAIGGIVLILGIVVIRWLTA